MAFKVGRCLLQHQLDVRNMTQKELAYKLNITPQQISKYVRNKQKMSIEVAGNIAMILGCNIEHLYEWIEVGKQE
ncbi:hypothetical protein AQ616_09325 [Oceanobacillus sp. E9]|uniref:helix-turn-helix transcriptional regulator n=1 Tax=Oceanobacillus TaxID=182709 RepID=UPI00034C4B58|nr:MULTISPECIES: helix-turn-helix transcriptional regulator [Oceanobacillus]OEH55233.1 hypothetical protein AQ616_09325 [Oceanobacillus sp. E9]